MHEVDCFRSDFRTACSFVMLECFFFYNNCQISRALIGSFLSPIRVQTDKILIYAPELSSSTISSQTVNFLINEILWTFLRWPNTVFARALADAVQRAHKDCKKQTCRQ